MTIGSARRFYLLKAAAADTAGEPALAAAWRAKQAATAGTDLPAAFPARAKLVAAGYGALEDLTGADVAELVAVGLTRPEATAALNALP